MYVNGKVTEQTWRGEENQSELCCLLDPPPITNIITSRGQKGGIEGKKKQQEKLCQIPPASEQNE